MRPTLPLAALALVLAAVPAHAAPIRIDMADNRFVPRTATVSVGDRVTWRNVGKAPHEVTAAAFRSGNVAPGQAWSWTAAAAGTYAYVCTYHEAAGMRATLVVRASAGAAGHPDTGGDRLALGLVLLAVCGVAGLSLRLGWRVS